MQAFVPLMIPWLSALFADAGTLVALHSQILWVMTGWSFNMLLTALGFVSAGYPTKSLTKTEGCLTRDARATSFLAR